MVALTDGLSYIDLEFQSIPGVIATAVIESTDGLVLVDPGPSSTLGTLRRTLAQQGAVMRDVCALLLTHIHLDHAGATGTLVRENPALRVYVHERGATHLAEPEKLLSSATRLYGAEMDRLWGEFLPVPSTAMRPLRGGEELSFGNRRLTVADTPGHASHHVCYHLAAAGLAFVGDTAGIRLFPDAYVLPPTPPPDVDLEAWHHSLGVIEAWRPQTLFLTHFGPSTGVTSHLSDLERHLDASSRLAQESLTLDSDEVGREEWFASKTRELLKRSLTGAQVRAYEAAGGFGMSWRGLARYWRKRAAA